MAKQHPEHTLRLQKDFGQQVVNKVRAGSNCLWIHITGDEGRAERQLETLALGDEEQGIKGFGYNFRVWDPVAGCDWLDEGSTDPLKAILAIKKNIADNAFILMRDLASLLNGDRWENTILRRALIELCKSNELTTPELARSIFLLSDSPIPHPSLRDHVDVIEHQLPNYKIMRTDAVQFILDSTTSNPDLKNDESPATLHQVTTALLGLSSAEANRVLSCAVSHNRGLSLACLPAIADEKANVVRKIDGLRFIPNNRITNADEIGGFDAYKEFLRARRLAYTQHAVKLGIDAPRGVALVGPPGCLHGDTPIFDPIDGSTATVKQRHQKGVPFHVVSIDHNNNAVIGKANPPHKYPASDMLRLTFSTGDKITVTHGHKLKSNHGYRASGVWLSHDLLELSDACRLPTISECALSALALNARRSRRRASDCRARCSAYPYQYGEQPLETAGICQASFPLLAGAQKHTHVSCDQDGSEPFEIGIRPASSYHHSRPDCYPRPQNDRDPSFVLLQRVAQSVPGGGLCLAAVRPLSASYQTDTALLLFASALPSMPVSYASSNLQYSGQVLTTIANDCHVVKAEPLPAEEYYDFHVPYYNNYWACGTFHSNTGKTVVARATAALLGLDLIIMDIGSMFDRFVGSSEAKMRSALQTVSAMYNCVLMVDEIV